MSPRDLAARAAAAPAAAMPASPAARSAVLLGFLLAAFLVVWTAPPQHGLEGIAHYTWLHTVLETSATVMAAMVFGVAWNAYSTERAGNIMLLALGLLAVAVVGTMHMLSFAGMPEFVTPAGPEKAINFWLAGRFLFAATLLAAGARRWGPFAWPPLRYAGLALTLAVCALIGWAGLFHAELLPRTFIEGSGLTAFKVRAEYTIVAMLAVAALLYARGAGGRPEHERWSLFAAAAVAALGELCFTLYSDVTDVFNLLGHLYHAIANLLIYRAVFVGSVHEPFERMRLAEQQTRAASDYASTLIETSPAGITVWNTDGSIAYTNAEAEKILRRSRAELRTMSYHALQWHATDEFGTPLEAQALPVGRVLATGAPVRGMRMAIDAPDGQRVHLLVNAAPLLDAQGQVQAVIAALEDVTARKEAENMLRTSEERLQLAMSAAHMGAWVLDLARDEYTFSDELGRLAGIGEGSARLSRQAFFELVHPDDRALVERHLQQALVKEQGIWVDFRVRSPSGELRWFSVQGRVSRDAGGSPSRMVGIAIDISQRKQAELAMARAHRALRSLSGVNELLIHATDERELLGQVCQTLVRDGGYRMAWVAEPAQDAACRVRALASFGDDRHFIDTADIRWSDSELGRGPTGTAVRTGLLQVDQNIAANPAMAPWREGLLARGWQSLIALPLEPQGSGHRVLVIAAGEADAFDASEVKFLRDLVEDLKFGVGALRMRIERDRMADEEARHESLLRQSLVDSIQSIAALAEMRDPYTAGHQRRVARLAVAIARELGLDEDRVEGLQLASLIHDVGKIQVPAEILNRPGRINPIEMALIKMHAQSGFDILKDIRFPWPIARIVHEHHERLDGSGYPAGLKGEQILLESRILTVADVVEAMTSHRPYRPGLGIDAALAELERHRGLWYDTAASDACLRLFRDGRFSFSEQERIAGRGETAPETAPA